MPTPAPSVLAALLVPLVVPVVLGAAPVAAAQAEADEPIELELDAGYAPVGPLIAPRGALLDPRDLPEAVKPYFDKGLGLTGVEQTLTVLLARNVGFILERGELDKAYRAHATALRDNWNAEIGALMERLDPAAPDAWALGVLWFDTGRRPSADFKHMSVVKAPELRFTSIEREAFDDLRAAQRLIAAFGPEMSTEDAQALLERIEGIEDLSDPWFGHGQMQLFMLSVGAWRDEVVAKNPFELTVEQFFDKCRNAFENSLVRSQVPRLPAEVVGDDTYFFEGFAVARVVPDVKGDDGGAWDAPAELVDYNRATHKPLFLLQVPEKKRYRADTRLDRVEIALIVGGEVRDLHDGKWPLR